MKTPLLLLGICAVLSSTAQTIALEDTLSTGNSMTYYVADSNAVDYASLVGTDLTWDYSTLGTYLGLSPNTNNVIDASGSEFSDDFPDAMYTEDFENSVVTYFTNDPSGNRVIVHGFVFQELSSVFKVLYNTDPLISVTFPLNQGDTYSDDIAGTAIVPIAGSFEITGSATVTADGSGTLKLVDDVYENVIRVHTIETSSGTPGIGGTVTFTRESYVYYDIDNFNMPIFVFVDIKAASGLGDYGFNAVYSKTVLEGYVGLEEEIKVESNLTLSIHPNPTVNNFTTVSLSEGVETLTIINSIGQEMISINTPSTSEQIDVSAMNVGIYFVQIVKDGSIITKKFIVK